MEPPLRRAVSAFVSSPARGLPLLFSQLRDSGSSGLLHALRSPRYLDTLLALLASSDPRACAGAALALTWHGGISAASDYCVLAHPRFLEALHSAFTLCKPTPGQRPRPALLRLALSLLFLIRVFSSSAACAEVFLYDGESLDFIAAWTLPESVSLGRIQGSIAEPPGALAGEILLAFLRHCADDSGLFVLYSHAALSAGLAERALHPSGLHKSLQQALRSLLLSLLRSDALRPLVLAELGGALNEELGTENSTVPAIAGQAANRDNEQERY